MKDKKNSLLQKALSSKNPKTALHSIDGSLNKQQKRINHDPSEINNYSSNLAANLSNKENTESIQSTYYYSIFNLIDDIRTAMNRGKVTLSIPNRLLQSI